MQADKSGSDTTFDLNAELVTSGFSPAKAIEVTPGTPKNVVAVSRQLK